MQECWDTRETLLKRAGNPNDEISWEEFVKFYENFIYQLIRKMNFNHHDAEEVMQDVFIKVWGKLHDFSYQKSKGRFRGWLCVTSRNAALDFIRRKKTRGVHCELFESDMLEQSVTEAEQVDEEEWRLYVSNKAWENIKSEYAPKTAQAFMMVTHGHSVEEVSEVLGVSDNTIYNAKSRIIKRLQQEVKHLNKILDI